MALLPALGALVAPWLVNRTRLPITVAFEERGFATGLAVWLGQSLMVAPFVLVAFAIGAWTVFRHDGPIYGIILALLIATGIIAWLVRQIRQDKDKAWWRRLGYVSASYAAALIAAILLVWFG